MKEKLDELVRDLTKVGSLPKSEARRRIMEFTLSVIDQITEHKDWPREDKYLHEGCPSGYCECIEPDWNKATTSANKVINEVKEKYGK